jgi:hypothetical protein
MEKNLSPSLVEKRWQLNIDKKVSKIELYDDAKTIQMYLRDEDCFNDNIREFEKASKRMSENIDLMVIKFIYKPKPGNGSFIGYTYIEEILNEARLQCLAAIYECKYDYKKSKEIFCYLTMTIHNACRQMMNRSSRQKEIKLNFMLNELIMNSDNNNTNDSKTFSKLKEIKNFDEFLDEIYIVQQTDNY